MTFRGTQVSFFAFFFTMTLTAAEIATADDVATLKRLDAQQKAMVTSVDMEGLAKLAHPNLRINAPTNRILTRDQLLSSIRSGKIAAEAFERTVEEVVVTGNIGVVMGREVFTPTPHSELGERYGAKPLNRRYTNVYFRENGRWLWLARHANVVPKS